MDSSLCLSASFKTICITSSQGSLVILWCYLCCSLTNGYFQSIPEILHFKASMEVLIIKLVPTMQILSQFRTFISPILKRRTRTRELKMRKAPVKIMVKCESSLNWSPSQRHLGFLRMLQTHLSANSWILPFIVPFKIQAPYVGVPVP